jgi:hypothetical protein
MEARFIPPTALDDTPFFRGRDRFTEGKGWEMPRKSKTHFKTAWQEWTVSLGAAPDRW